MSMHVHCTPPSRDEHGTTGYFQYPRVPSHGAWDSSPMLDPLLFMLDRMGHGTRVPCSSRDRESHAQSHAPTTTDRGTCDHARGPMCPTHGPTPRRRSLAARCTLHHSRACTSRRRSTPSPECPSRRRSIAPSPTSRPQRRRPGDRALAAAPQATRSLRRAGRAGDSLSDGTMRDRPGDRGPFFSAAVSRRCLARGVR